jgi:hypothetical protein
VTSADSPERPSAVERYGPWVALYAAIALTASGEFELATLVGFPGWIAWALPTAIDVYVVQAMRRHRDVAGALVLMVATNAIYHLAASGLFGVTGAGLPAWWLVVLVAAIAPVIVWRVHRITEPRSAESQIPLTDSTTRQDTPAPTPTPVPPVAKTAPVAPSASPVPVAPTVAPAPEPVADKTPTTGGNDDRQNPPTDPAPAASKPAKTATPKPAKTALPRVSKKAPRRSMGDWVEVAGPIFHAEFKRLRRQPTASEFATAIDTAGLGRVSDSTAKNIRTEILDRTDVPALDDSD